METLPTKSRQRLAKEFIIVCNVRHSLPFCEFSKDLQIWQRINGRLTYACERLYCAFDISLESDAD
jgi:hypothetical protein